MHTVHCEKPFLDWAIFRDRNLVCGVLITSVYAYVGLVPMVLLPSMMEELRGLEVFTTGLAILPRGLANIVSMIVAGYLATRIDARFLLAGGLVVFSLSSWHMAHFNMDIGMSDLVWPTVIQGVAMGFIWVPAMSLMYATISSSLRTSAASMISLTYSLSSSFGIALSVTVLSRSVQVNVQELGAFVEPTSKIVQNSDLLGEFYRPETLASMAAEVSVQSATLAYANVFWMIAVSALLVIPLAFLQRRRRAS